MKTKMAFAVLFVTMLGCRNEFVDLCPNNSGIATAVAIVSDCASPEDGISTVPAGDTTNISIYKLHAYVYNSESIMIKDVEWRVSDPELLVLAPIEASAETRREAMTLVQTIADILDRGGDTEPEATVTACVTNDCEGIDTSCVECQPEICSAPHTVRSVINAEGAWELSGATFPFTVAIYASQTGRTLDAISSYYEPEIHSRQINFSSGDTSYVGQFTDRTHVTGEAIRSPVGENLGTWTAMKCPDSGCAPFGP
jgi:hypothetical protein